MTLSCESSKIHLLLNIICTTTKCMSWVLTLRGQVCNRICFDFFQTSKKRQVWYTYRCSLVKKVHADVEHAVCLALITSPTATNSISKQSLGHNKYCRVQVTLFKHITTLIREQVEEMMQYKVDAIITFLHRPWTSPSPLEKRISMCRLHVYPLSIHVLYISTWYCKKVQGISICHSYLASLFSLYYLLFNSS